MKLERHCKTGSEHLKLYELICRVRTDGSVYRERLEMSSENKNASDIVIHT